MRLFRAPQIYLRGVFSRDAGCVPKEEGSCVTARKGLDGTRKRLDGVSELRPEGASSDEDTVPGGMRGPFWLNAAKPLMLRRARWTRPELTGPIILGSAELVE